MLTGWLRRTRRSGENLRDAFLKTMSDPEALAEAKKGRMEVKVTSGEELEALVKEIFDSPPEVIEPTKKCWHNRNSRKIPSRRSRKNLRMKDFTTKVRSK